MSEPSHYVGLESFARNLFNESKDVRDAAPFWLDLRPDQRAHWRRQVWLLLVEGIEQNKVGKYEGKATTQPGREQSP